MRCSLLGFVKARLKFRLFSPPRRSLTRPATIHELDSEFCGEGQFDPHVSRTRMRSPSPEVTRLA